MKLTIISGASRGIGKAIAEDLKTLDSPVIQLSSKIVDFESYYAVFSKVSAILSEHKPEEINLVLCAAQIGTAYKVDLSETDRIYKINVVGNLAVIRAMMRFSLKKIRIVWFAGGGAASPYPEFFAYSLSKVAVVRAVENLSLILKELYSDVSIVALAPGAVDTDMLKKVIQAKCFIRTRTDISEPVNFVRMFITDQLNSKSINGKFIHVRDDLDNINFNQEKHDLFTLRRIEE